VRATAGIDRFIASEVKITEKGVSRIMIVRYYDGVPVKGLSGEM
jgi:hypothetical protein